MEPMTKRNLALWLADEFHDWIDGDDPVDEYDVYGNSVVVKFESGVMFHIEISDYYE